MLSLYDKVLHRTQDDGYSPLGTIGLQQIMLFTLSNEGHFVRHCVPYEMLHD